MSLLSLFRRKEEASEAEDYGCPHLIMVPTWDNPQDMGKDDRATGYRCYACAATLTIEEAKEARERSAIAL